MRRVLPLAILAFLLVAAPAQAYKLGGKKWPGRTITYNASVPEYADAIAAAMQAWNTSGVRIRFKPTSRRRAQIRIVRDGRGLGGHATLGYARPTDITRRVLVGAEHIELNGPFPCGRRISVPGQGRKRVKCFRGPKVWLAVPTASARQDPLTQIQMGGVVAHELGHVLGLQHTERGCRTMNATLWSRCEPPQPWESQCRLLEADDVRGAVKRYGGKVKPLTTPQFCDPYGPLAAVGGLTAAYDPSSGQVTATWQRPDSDRVWAFRTSVSLDTCTTPADEMYASSETTQTAAFDVPPEGGRYCISVAAIDQWERLGVISSVFVDVPAQESPPPDEEY